MKPKNTMSSKIYPKEAVYRGYYVTKESNGKLVRHPLTYYFDERWNELGFTTGVSENFNSSTKGRKWSVASLNALVKEKKVNLVWGKPRL